ncbi:MAG: aminotransferase class IV family protein [Phycisphaerales bacterium]|nr:aminotransferase class IV family protein [Phycisphaerales bacterium]
MTTVFLNGLFVEAAEARISVMDAGLQHGVGLFETLTGGSEGGLSWAHRLEDHIDRLIGSARALGLSDRLRKPALAEAVLAVLARHGQPSARLRLTVTGGDLNMLRRPPAAGGLDPTVLIVAQPAMEYPPAWFEEGVMVSVADLHISPLDPTAGHKTLAYWPRLRELQGAAARGAGEALVFSVTNHLVGGCVSNVFVVPGPAGDRDQLWTPIARGEEPPGIAVPSATLPGITRLAVLEGAERLGIAAHRRMISVADVLSAREVFLTNSGWGVLPVVAVERSVIGDGRPGPVSRRLRRIWLDGRSASAETES